MSWSITFIGTAENVAKALEEESNKLSGASKVEYDAALPHLVGLVKQNWTNDKSPVLQISASGHGYDTYRQCMVTIQHVGGQIV